MNAEEALKSWSIISGNKTEKNGCRWASCVYSLFFFNWDIFPSARHRGEYRKRWHYEPKYTRSDTIAFYMYTVISIDHNVTINKSLYHYSLLNKSICIWVDNYDFGSYLFDWGREVLAVSLGQSIWSTSRDWGASRLPYGLWYLRVVVSRSIYRNSVTCSLKI